MRTVERAAEIGLGTRNYHLVSIDGEDMLNYLKENQLSLVVRNRGEQTTYTQHGVRDLYDLQNSRVLQGAAVADKIIGKGAAALMIAGGVKYVTTEAISQEAIDMLRAAGIDVQYHEVLDYIPNHDHTGECPLEQRLHGISDPAECLPIVNAFVESMSNK